MSNGSSAGGGGMSLGGVIGVVFIVLKLCHVIDWSWWWVLLPFWLIVPLVLIGLLVCVVIEFARRR